ncbi:hypothetical protein B0F90DRAFT_1670501 [Multifurca ochricompacta]|uniref:Chromo shadow domain-containing protein n=1 Tax=Multifurca ochricompacta TaxID=376703 RepID=A0AAD4LXU3_9AGAM|nr:hypothetical protein B0F90DRAFT_1670501 [Multifurca ochricompacta]
MAPAVHDSDSDDANAELSPKRSHPESPEQLGQSDQPGPADSGEDSEVYEIEAILDAKRGATGSLISEYWVRQGKKKGVERAGRKSDVRTTTTKAAASRRPVAVSVESTTPEPISTSTTKKRGRGRAKAKADSVEAGAEEEEEEEGDLRSRKRDKGSAGIDFLEPSAIKKWGGLPSWERHIETVDTVEKAEDGDLFIYFKLKGEKLIKFYEAHLKWRQAEGEQESE